MTGVSPSLIADLLLRKSARARRLLEAVVPNKSGEGCHDDKTGHPARCPGQGEDEKKPEDRKAQTDQPQNRAASSQPKEQQKKPATAEEKVRSLSAGLEAAQANLDKGKAALATVKAKVAATRKVASRKGATDADRKTYEDAKAAQANVQAYVDRAQAAHGNLKKAHGEALKAHKSELTSKVKSLDAGIKTTAKNIATAKKALTVAKRKVTAAKKAADRAGTPEAKQEYEKALAQQKATEDYIGKATAAQKNLQLAHKEAVKAQRQAGGQGAKKTAGSKAGTRSPAKAPAKAAATGKPSQSPSQPASPRKEFADPSESKAVQDLLAGKSKHSLPSGGFGGNTDTLLGEVLRESGRAEKPQVVSRKKMNDLKKSGWKVMYRGNENGARSGAEYSEQFRSGEMYIGSGIYGNGVYAAAVVGDDPSEKKASSEARGYARKDGSVIRMALHPEAKVVKHGDLLKERKEYHNQLRNDFLSGKVDRQHYDTMMSITKDDGRFAALRNYDAIDAGDYPGKEGYMVILNRSMLAVEDKDQ